MTEGTIGNADTCDNAGNCNCTQACTPWYGREIPGDDNPLEDYFPTWEDCGKACKEDEQCNYWSWNVPSCDGCKGSCKLFFDFVEDSHTQPNHDWISGPEDCYISAGSSNFCHAG